MEFREFLHKTASAGLQPSIADYGKKLLKRLRYSHLDYDDLIRKKALLNEETDYAISGLEKKYNNSILDLETRASIREMPDYKLDGERSMLTQRLENAKKLWDDRRAGKLLDLDHKIQVLEDLGRGH